MKRIKILVGLIISLCSIEAALAGQWQCSATNDRGMTWWQRGSSQAGAAEGARARCYANGSRRCHVDCRFIGGGNSHGYLRWVCRVRDLSGRLWVSTGNSASNACFTAQNQCRAWHNARGIRGYACNVVSRNRT